MSRHSALERDRRNAQLEAEMRAFLGLEISPAERKEMHRPTTKRTGLEVILSVRDRTTRLARRFTHHAKSSFESLAIREAQEAAHKAGFMDWVTLEVNAL